MENLLGFGVGAARVRTPALRKRSVNQNHACSMGLNSGLYCGTYLTATLCGAALDAVTSWRRSLTQTSRLYSHQRQSWLGLSPP